MIENIIKVLKGNFSIMISLLALITSIFSLILSEKNSKLNSYSQKAIYSIFLLKINWFNRLIKNYNFHVKIFNSVISQTIPFNYGIVIKPYIGGIHKAKIFSSLNENSYLGTEKNVPIITNNRTPIYLKKYAYIYTTYFSSSPLFSYFSFSMEKDNMMLNRYHLYILITDYCNNTEIWYISFSLLLKKNSNMYNEIEWKKFKGYCGFKYYCFDDINIVSSKELCSNIEKIENFKKTLEEIEKNTDFDSVKYDLQLYEMKEYLLFLEKTKNFI